MSAPPPEPCCQPGCEAQAIWRIDDPRLRETERDTYACLVHVRQLGGDDVVNTITPWNDAEGDLPRCDSMQVDGCPCSCRARFEREHRPVCGRHQFDGPCWRAKS